MKINVNISSEPRGYHWVSNCKNTIFSKGYIVNSRNSEKYLIGQELNEYLTQYENEEQLKKDLLKFNGNFAFIIIWNSESFSAVVDRQRSFPLFYFENNGDIFVTDRINNTISSNYLKINDENLRQYSRTVCSYNENTIFDGVFQVRPSHFLSAKNYTFTQYEYFSFRYNENTKLTLEEKLEKLSTQYDIIFNRVVKHLNGRQVMLPLSGGRDSRLILYYLTKHGHNNIITYSYGYEGTDDQRLSKIVAEYFNVPYYYIHCDRIKMRKMSRTHLKPYYYYAGNGCSIPCVQELYVVYELGQLGLIQKNCVFMPGHGGDFYAGARAVDFGNEKPIKLCERVFRHLFFQEYRYKNTHKNESEREKEARDFLVNSGILPDKITSRNEASEVVERYFFYERESKFIQNCVRYYDYWDYEWMTPLEDIELAELWLTYSLEDRVNRNLYDLWVQKYYPDGLRNIEFAGKPKTVFKIKWCYGYVPLHDYIKSRLFGSYVSMNQFAWKKYSKLINRMLR